MSSVIVVGVDGSEACERAARFAVDHAGDDGTVVLLHVVPWSPFSLQTAEDNARRSSEKERELSEGEQLLGAVAAAVEGTGTQLERLVMHGHPAETLSSVADERGASHVVVGRIGQSRVRALLFGSTPGTLIQISAVPVTVVP